MVYYYCGRGINLRGSQSNKAIFIRDSSSLAQYLVDIQAKSSASSTASSATSIATVVEANTGGRGGGGWGSGNMLIL